MTDSALFFIPENGGGETEELLTSTLDETGTENSSKQPFHKAVLCKKRNCKYFKYETNARQRKRIKANLLSQLESVIEEYHDRVKGEAVVVAMSNSFESNFRIIGTCRLRTVVKDFVADIEKNISTAMETNNYQGEPLDGNAVGEVKLFPLPPLRVNDTAISLNKMTQAHLRAFIPLMLKYSLGRGKPGWGKKELRPVWWPTDVPWANIRTDARSPQEKMKISWSYTLRRIVKCCYEYHGRLDLIEDYEFIEPFQLSKETKATVEKPNSVGETKKIAVMTPDGPITLYCTVVSVSDNCSILPDNQTGNEEAAG